MTDEMKDLERLVAEKAEEGRLACAAAFSIADGMLVAPALVGKVADEAKIRLSRCQLGLFGYYPEKRIVTPAPAVAPALESAIRGALIDGRLECAAAWEIAKSLEVAKMDVSCACEALGIRIKSCQLGAF